MQAAIEKELLRRGYNTSTLTNYENESIESNIHSDFMSEEEAKKIKPDKFKTAALCYLRREFFVPSDTPF